MDTVRRLLRYIKPYWRQFALGLIASLAVVAGNLAIPGLLGRAVNILSQKGNLSELSLVVVAAVLLTLVKGLFTYGHKYLMALVGNRTVANLRNQIFQHLQKMSLAYHESHRLGEMVARITNDVNLIQTSMSGGIAELLYQLILLVGIIAAIFVINWRLALLSIITIPLAFFVISKAGSQIRGISHRVQEKTADLASILQEALAGIRVIKAFTLEHLIAKRFAEANEANYRPNMKSAQINATSSPLLELIFAVALGVVIWYAGLEVLHNNLNVGGLFTFITLVTMAGTPLTSITANYNNLQGALAGADRIFTLLDEPEEIRESGRAKLLPRPSGRVCFEQVAFAYREGQPVLRGINLEATPGEVVALVGPSGAGKTTLVNLIPRFYDPTSGRVLVDGYDLREIQAASLRQQIGLVPQETILFSASVRENITYGRLDASEAEIAAAAKAANAEIFIKMLPDGYDTILGERGASLSGGQRQRIAIARALLRNPRILILDEATSSLDTESEGLVQEALERLMRERTTFVIAHRLSTIRFAHKIIVLVAGEIAAQGTHEELMAASDIYQKLYQRGFTQENEGSAAGDEAATEGDRGR